MSNPLTTRLDGLDERTLRERAWIGDAVLTLFARQWLSASGKALDNAEAIAMTSNAFLATIGQPTKVEARIGEVYAAEGLEAAFGFIETHLIPRYTRQRRRR